MKLTTTNAILLVAMWLALLVALGHASTAAIGPGGFCRVTPRPETDLTGRSVVACRWAGVDETGDGVPEVVQTVLLLDRKGAVDCGRSVINILDVTVPRYQLVRWFRVC